jgi:isoquinoline 1-oxidoreductase beta subunit
VQVTRRTFLQGLAGGLALGFVGGRLRRLEAAQGDPAALAPSVFVHIAEGGLVTIVCSRSEMGQGVRSSIPELIASELGADMARVEVVQADGDARYGDQNTDGSTSIRKHDERFRQAGAAARLMLAAAAAKRWKVSPLRVVVRDHQVLHAGRSLGFGELVAEAARLPVPEGKALVLRPVRTLSLLANPRLPLRDGPDIVTGKAVFGADVRVPGMLIAVIARPPVPGGKVVSFDRARAMAVPGVEKVIELPPAKKPYAHQVWGGVAVLARTTWAALRGRALLDVRWDHGEDADHDTARHQEALLASVRAGGKPLRQVGDAPAALARAARVLEAEYQVPSMHHLMMEPPVALARLDAGRCEIWAPTQSPQGARKQVATLLGLAEDQVTVHVTLLGGGFGRKGKADFVCEAAFLARAAGAPVRVQWTREDDVRHGYYNAISAQRIRVGLDDQGKALAWHQQVAFPPIANTFTLGVEGPTIEDFQQGVADLALDVPNVRVESCAARAHGRVGWYRSVYNIFTGFSWATMVDELAHARGADPRDVLLEIIGPPRQLSAAELGVDKVGNYRETLADHPVDAGRLRHVVERVTSMCGWRKLRAGGRKLGLAAHRSFVSTVAAVISVVPHPRYGVRVDEAWVCIDAGRIVNIDRVHAQMEGAVLMGLSNAMYGGISKRAGATVESNFRDARILRMPEAPRRIHVEVVASEARPGGVGEPGTPPVAPALGNAIFALTGKRLRELPFARALAAR